jgi:LacI family transcriptional regulator
MLRRGGCQGRWCYGDGGQESGVRDERGTGDGGLDVDEGVVGRRGRRATQRDVARRAGVSTAVVSYVINDGPRPTSPAVRERVRQAIAELEYHPNGFARGLRARRTHTIAFVTSDWNPLESFGSHYLASILSELTGELKDRGYYLLMFPMMIGEETAALEGLLWSGRLDGVVVRLIQDPPATDALLEVIRRAGLPSVCIERPGDPRFAMPTVTYDDAEGAFLATTHLITEGHRRIGHLGGDMRYATAQARLDGYRRALESAGLPGDPSLIELGDWGTGQASEVTRRLLALPDPPTAVFAASDDMAVGVLEAVRSAGLRAPDDVAIVGFDDIPLAREISVPLSTVRIPLAEMGRRAAALVLQDGDGGEAVTEVLPVELVRRQSS